MVCNSSMVSDVREPISVHQAACACACVRVCQRKMKDKADNMRGESAHFFRWDVRACVCACVCVRARTRVSSLFLSLSSIEAWLLADAFQMLWKSKEPQLKT